VSPDIIPAPLRAHLLLLWSRALPEHRLTFAEWIKTR
jgi:hypothetical protein